MILKELKLKNFRSYLDETAITFDELTVLIGRNDAGKSTLLEALDIFFNDASIDKDDASVGGDNKDVRFTCVFEVPDDFELVLDTEHPTSLANEYLLREDGLLEITRVFNCSTAKGKPSNVFLRAHHPTAEDYDKLHSLTLAKLKTLATKLGVDTEGVNLSIKAPLRRAIWDHAEDLCLAETHVDLAKESDEIWKQLQKHLPVYALFKSDRASTDQDGEAQDPMKTVIKETLKQHEAQLEIIVSQIQGELEAIANKTVAKIEEMSPDLAKSLKPSVTNKPWNGLFSVNLAGEDGISINKRGSGTRRLILLNFFRAKAEDAAGVKGSGTIYAVEEPETSQHPNHQMMLLDAFREITQNGNAQVILTTHTPTLVRKIERKALRFITTDAAGQRIVQHGSEDSTLQDIKGALGVLPDHDVKLFLGVEGKWDIEFLKRISKMLNDSDNTIPCLETAESDGHLVFIPLGGSSMELWTSRISGLERPELYFTDRDTAPPNPPAYQTQINAWNAQDNTEALCTNKRELENYLHPTAIQTVVATYPSTTESFSDIPVLFARARHEASESTTAWDDLTAEKQKKKQSRAKATLNRDACDNMTTELLSESDPAGEIRSLLSKIAAHLN